MGGRAHRIIPDGVGVGVGGQSENVFPSILFSLESIERQSKLFGMGEGCTERLDYCG